jgi:hypothetical protein
MPTFDRVPFVVPVLLLSASVLAGCGAGREKLGNDCTEVGPDGAAHGLEPCLKLASKYGSGSHNELGIAWSGIQMHCSFQSTLTPVRQKECNNACEMMQVFAQGNSAPDGIGGGTYVRKGAAAGECVGGGGGRGNIAGKKTAPGVKLSE